MPLLDGEIKEQVKRKLADLAGPVQEIDVQQAHRRASPADNWRL